MAEQSYLEAQTRKEFGTRISRQMRRKGTIPVTVYHGKDKPLHLAIQELELNKVLRAGARIVSLKHESGEEKVFLSGFQYDALGEKILHIDVTKVSADEKLEMEVALVLKGTPVGVTEEGGTLDQHIKTLQISCLPDAIPEEITVNVSELKLNDNLTLADVKPPEGVELTQEGELVLAGVSEHREEEVEASDIEPGPAEPEIISKEKSEESEEA